MGDLAVTNHCYHYEAYILSPRTGARQAVVDVVSVSAVVVGAGGTLVLERLPRTLRTVGTTWARRVGVVAEVRQAVVAFGARQAD